MALFFFLVQTECVHTYVVRAMADVVATKLGIILFLPSTYFSPRRGLPTIVWGFKFVGGAETERSACAMSKRGPPLANMVFKTIIRSLGS